MSNKGKAVQWSQLSSATAEAEVSENPIAVPNKFVEALVDAMSSTDSAFVGNSLKTRKSKHISTIVGPSEIDDVLILVAAGVDLVTACNSLGLDVFSVHTKLMDGGENEVKFNQAKEISREALAAYMVQVGTKAAVGAIDPKAAKDLIAGLKELSTVRKTDNNDDEKATAAMTINIVMPEYLKKEDAGVIIDQAD